MFFLFLFIGLSSGRVVPAAQTWLLTECRGGKELHQGVVVRKFWRIKAHPSTCLSTMIHSHCIASHFLYNFHIFLQPFSQLYFPRLVPLGRHPFPASLPPPLPPPPSPPPLRLAGCDDEIPWYFGIFIHPLLHIYIFRWRVQRKVIKINIHNQMAVPAGGKLVSWLISAQIF